jgi:hypothetical protein
MEKAIEAIKWNTQRYLMNQKEGRRRRAVGKKAE